MMTRTEATSSGYETGQVKWYNGDKGFGFIVPDQGGPDVFIHATVAQRANLKPVEGMNLAFKSRRGPKGLVADEIEHLSGA